MHCSAVRSDFVPENLNEHFIRKPSVTSGEAVALLKRRFPQESQLFGSEEDPEIPQQFYAYERLAEEIQNRTGDVFFLESVTRFINELSLSKDPLLENLLVVSLLERLAADPVVVSAMRPHLENEALNFLNAVEREFRKPENTKL